MINIIFRSQTISFDNDNLNLQYFDSGDLHGNDNFRIPDKYARYRTLCSPLPPPTQRLSLQHRL